MGSGKSTVGPLLARRLGCGFVDLDATIEAAAGRSVRELFAERGETEFRRLESEALAGRAGTRRPPGDRHRRRGRAGRGQPPAAPGGGRGGVAVGTPRRCWRAGSVATRAARCWPTATPKRTLTRLLEEREGRYRQAAHHVVAAAPGLPEQVAERVAARLRPAEAPAALDCIEVDLGPRRYPVLVGPGARERLARVLPAGHPAGGGRRPARHPGRRRPRHRAPGVPHRGGRGRPRRWPRWRTCAAAGRPGASPGPTAWWRWAAAWSPTWPASPPPPTTGASPSCTCRPRCWARWTRPSAARPGSTCPRERTWSARSGNRPPCCATPRCWPACPSGSTAAGWASWPSTTSSAASDLDRLALPARVAAAVAIKAAVVAGDEREGGAPGHPQLRPHAGPRPRGGRRLRSAPRRGGGHRPRLRRRAGPDPGAHRRRAGVRAPPGGGGLRAARRSSRPAPTPIGWSS